MFIERFSRAIRQSASRLLLAFGRDQSVSESIAARNGSGTACADVTIVQEESFFSILRKAIQFGEEGKLTVIPEMLWIPATSDCNLRCVMCSSYSKEHQNFTEEDANILFDTHIVSGVVFGGVKYIELTSAESLLNIDLHKIIRLARSRFPGAKIVNTTNATLSVMGGVKEAIQGTDYLGISVDGATAETFEDIRRGANFEEVIKNIRAIMQCRKEVEYESQDVKFQFVATATNIHELPAVIRLAHEMGVPAVFAQRVELRPPVKKVYKIEKYDLDVLPHVKVRDYLREAQSEADRLGISLRLTTELSDWAVDAPSPPPTNRGTGDQPIAFSPTQASSVEFKAKVAMCMVPWTTAPNLKKSESDMIPILVCCHMPHGNGDKVVDFKNAQHLRGKGFNEIFNSPEYWTVRKGLLDGWIADGACRGCQYVGMSQFQWSPEKQAELRAAVIKLEQASLGS